MILSKQKCCLLSTGISTESEKRSSVLQIRQGFLATRNMTRINVGLARSYVKLLLSSWKNIYVQFDGMVHQQIMGIPMGTNCAPLIADLFLYCYERDFMSDLQKSKRFDLIDTFNDTSRYRDDMFTIDNPEFEKHIPDVYPAELQLNKANTSDKETSFLDLNIKVMVVTFIPVFTTNAMTLDFLLLISHGWVVTSLDSHRMVFTFLSWLDLLDVVLAFWISILKNLQITTKLLTQGYRYHKLRKTFGKFFRSYSETSVEIWWYFVPRIFVKRNLSPGLLRWSSLQTKEGQRYTEFHLVGFENSQTPSTTTVWPSDHREDYRSCAWPFYSLVRTFPKALHSD